MRIRTIEIDNFGKFHRRRFELMPGLNRIAGENEFGKTTLLEFIRRIFYGFPDGRSSLNPYPPLHSDIRYGGRLFCTLDDGRQVVIERLGLAKGGELRVSDEVTGMMLTEDEVAGVIPIGETFYRNVYAITLAELLSEQPLSDEEIRGRLYGAALDLRRVSVSAMRKDLQRRMDQLYRPKGSSQELNLCRKELELLRDNLQLAEGNLPEFLALEEELAQIHIERTVLGEEKKRQDDLQNEAKLLEQLAERIKREEAELAAVAPMDSILEKELAINELKNNLEHFRSIRKEWADLAPGIDPGEKPVCEWRGTPPDEHEVMAFQMRLCDEATRNEVMEERRQKDLLAEEKSRRYRLMMLMMALVVLAGAGLILPWFFLIAPAVGGIGWWLLRHRQEVPLSWENEARDGWNHLLRRHGIEGEIAPEQILAQLHQMREWERQLLDWKNLDARRAELRKLLLDWDQRAISLAGGESSGDFESRLLRLAGELEEAKRRAFLRESLSKRIEVMRREYLEKKAAAPEHFVMDATLTEKMAELDRKLGGGAVRLAQLKKSSDFALLQNEYEVKRTMLKRKMKEFLTLCAASALLEDGIHRYEEERQPEVIRRSSRLFAMMTNGCYTGVRKQLTSEELTVIAADGSSKVAAQLSSGTREQLLLSMRLALIDYSEETLEKMPVVLDDVLVNFDPARQKSALTALEEFAKNRQVVLFVSSL